MADDSNSILDAIKPNQGNVPIYTGLISAIMSGLAGMAGGGGPLRSLVAGAAGGASGAGEGVELPTELKKQQLGMEQTQAHTQYYKDIAETRRKVEADREQERENKRQLDTEAAARVNKFVSSERAKHAYANEVRDALAGGSPDVKPLTKDQVPITTTTLLDYLEGGKLSAPERNTLVAQTIAQAARKEELEARDKAQTNRLLSGLEARGVEAERQIPMKEEAKAESKGKWEPVEVEGSPAGAKYQKNSVTGQIKLIPESKTLAPAPKPESPREAKKDDLAIKKMALATLKENIHYKYSSPDVQKQMLRDEIDLLSKNQEAPSTVAKKKIVTRNAAGELEVK